MNLETAEVFLGLVMSGTTRLHHTDTMSHKNHSATYYLIFNIKQ